MKIIHVIPHLKMGGAETLVKEYALNINQEKFEFIIITLEEKSNSFNERVIQDSNIRIINLGDEIPYKKDDNFFYRKLKKYRRYKLIKDYILTERPDVIHSHLQTNDYLLSVNTRKLGISLYHTLHSEVDVLFGKGKKLYELSTRFCIKKRNMTLITLHERMNYEAKKFFGTENCIVVNNGINIESFKNVLIDKEKIKEEIGISRDHFIIGHVGRFTKAKNHELLIDIFLETKLKCPKAILILIGTGELEGKIKYKVKESGIENSVLFLGNRKDIPELMHAMDVFVFPSRHEGFGNVLIEAQAAEVKCVVSDRIPNEVFLTNYITSLSLNAPVEDWCREILNSKVQEKKEAGLKNYDIKNVMKKLEFVYMSNIK